MVYPNNIESKIDFTVIREELLRRCASPLGREQVDAMRMETDYDTVLHLLSLTDQMRLAQADPMLSFPRGDIHDLREPIARIRIEGLFLDEAELDDLRHTLSFAVDLENFFASLDEQKYPLLKTLSPFAVRLSPLVDAINRILDRYGRLADNASPELHRIRRELTNQQGAVGRALAAILRQAKTDGFVDADAAPTLREGRLVIPVSPGYKRKIGGIVHDESATGKTVYIEPQQVVEANNRIRELESAERRERIRILQAVTGVLRPNTDQILASQRMLAQVDFLSAKVSLANTLRAIRPELVNTPCSNGRKHVILSSGFTTCRRTKLSCPSPSVSVRITTICLSSPVRMPAVSPSVLRLSRSFNTCFNVDFSSPSQSRVEQDSFPN